MHLQGHVSPEASERLAHAGRRLVRPRRVLGRIAAVIIILLLLVDLRVVEAAAARRRIARRGRAAVGRVNVVGIGLSLRRDLLWRQQLDLLRLQLLRKPHALAATDAVESDKGEQREIGE